VTHAAPQHRAVVELLKCPHDVGMIANGRCFGYGQIVRFQGLAKQVLVLAQVDDFRRWKEHATRQLTLDPSQSQGIGVTAGDDQIDGVRLDDGSAGSDELGRR